MKDYLQMNGTGNSLKQTKVGKENSEAREGPCLDHKYILGVQMVFFFFFFRLWFCFESHYKFESYKGIRWRAVVLAESPKI